MLTPANLVMAFFGIILVLVIGRLTRNILIAALKDTLIVGTIVGTLTWVTGRFYPEDPQQFLESTLVNFLDLYHLYRLPVKIFASLFFLSLLIRWQLGKTVVSKPGFRRTMPSEEHDEYTRPVVRPRDR